MIAKKILAWTGGVLAVGLVLIALAIGFTVLTHYTAAEVRVWVEAAGGLAAAFAAIGVALIGFRAQRVQAREALEHQAAASEAAAIRAAEQSREVDRERRIWDRRIEIYMDILKVLNDVTWINEPDGDEADAVDQGYPGRHLDGLSELELYVSAFGSDSVLNAVREYERAAARAMTQDDDWIEAARSWGKSWKRLVDTLRAEIAGTQVAVPTSDR